ncbi:uncharacterized protein N7482_001284 [Penicillium canariense]|uniref:Uncharacterized protein n=1 Tax=Penicillium canariense TaxID=189055 RepID=A0A9W9IFG4_9EURO|nr:uncharacterized protein N7482_001284 [Penicillium canariense]KAJ5175407.1 hypothetical protein N7482_001284 [Penicillium canariense]
MSPKIVLGRSFFSKDDVKLASLIPNILDIELDALESVLPLQEGDYTVRKVDDNLAIFKAEKDRDFRAFLSKLLNLISQSSTQAGLQLTARSGHIYNIKQPSAWFLRLCETTEVREWLQEQIEDGNDVHFVVGFHTLFDASTAEGLALTSAHGGNFSVALGELSGLPVNGFTNVGASASFTNNQAATHRYIAPGEQIFAVRLKRVVFRFLKPRDVDNAHLEKTSRWRMSSDTRSAGDEFSEIVEASLDGFSSAGEYDERDGNDDAELTDDNTEYYVLDE